jgi:hypothetical protein
VRVRHRLGDLAQQPQLRFRGNTARMVGLPLVEPLGSTSTEETIAWIGRHIVRQVREAFQQK